MASIELKIKKYLFFTYFLFSITICSSQNYADIVKFSAATTANNQFDTSASKTKINQMDADISLPIKLNEKLVIVTGMIYEGFQTKLFSNGSTKTFGAYTLKMGFNKIINNRLSSTFVLLPKISSDFKTTNQNDFQLGLVGILKYTKTKNLNYKLGVYVNTDLFGPLFVPLLGLYYLSPNKKFETNIMLPFGIDANYKVTSWMHLGCNFNAQLRTYHLSDVTFNHPNTYVARSTNELFGYLRFNISKNIIIQSKCGISLGRRMRVYDLSDKVNFGLPATFIGDKRHQINSDITDGLIFQASFIYRVHFEKK